MLMNISADVMTEAARLWKILNTYQKKPIDVNTSTECLNALGKMLTILKNTPYEEHIRDELNDLKASLIASNEVINAIRQELLKARKIQVALSNAPPHDHNYDYNYTCDHKL